MILRKNILVSIFLITTMLGGCQFSDKIPKLGEKDAFDSLLKQRPSPNLSSESQNQSENSITELEESIHKLVNQYRRSQNLPPLKLDSRISQEARIHSENMAAGKVPFSHNGFEERAKAVGKYISYRKFAENVAFNQGYSDPPKSAVEGWINSPGHEKNMVGDFNLTGIGVAKNSKGEYYFTQLFALDPPRAKRILIPELENSLHTFVNQHRSSLNLPPLKLDYRITKQAKLHSQNMAAGKIPFSNRGFEQRGKAIEKWIPYRKFAENVAYNQGYPNPTQPVVQGWIQSGYHRKNIEGDFNLTGIGIAKNSKGEYYFTQLFVESINLT